MEPETTTDLKDLLLKKNKDQYEVGSYDSLVSLYINSIHQSLESTENNSTHTFLKSMYYAENIRSLNKKEVDLIFLFVLKTKTSDQLPFHLRSEYFPFSKCFSFSHLYSELKLVDEFYSETNPNDRNAFR